MISDDKYTWKMQYFLFKIKYVKTPKTPKTPKTIKTKVICNFLLILMYFIIFKMMQIK